MAAEKVFSSNYFIAGCCHCRRLFISGLVVAILFSGGRRDGGGL